MYYDECDCTKIRVCRRNMGREGEFVKKTKTAVQMTAAKKILGC